MYSTVRHQNDKWANTAVKKHVGRVPDGGRRVFRRALIILKGAMHTQLN